MQPKEKKKAIKCKPSQLHMVCFAVSRHVVSFKCFVLDFGSLSDRELFLFMSHL